MTTENQIQELVSLDLERPIWDRFFTVAPLIIVGSREGSSYNFAPKHMVTPLGWENRIGFVCTPLHHTHQNIVREGVFTITYPRPSDIITASLSASPRCDDNSQPGLDSLPTVPSDTIDGRYIADGLLYFGCRLERIIDGFGSNELIVGSIVEALANPDALRVSDIDDQERVHATPLLAYISPGYYAHVDRIAAFPFAEGTHR